MSRKTTRDDLPMTRSAKRTRLHSPARETPVAKVPVSNLPSIDMGLAGAALAGLCQDPATQNAPAVAAFVDEGPLTPCSGEETPSSPSPPLLAASTTAIAATAPSVNGPDTNAGGTPLVGDRIALSGGAVNAVPSDAATPNVQPTEGAIPGHVVDASVVFSSGAVGNPAVPSVIYSVTNGGSLLTGLNVHPHVPADSGPTMGSGAAVPYVVPCVAGSPAVTPQIAGVCSVGTGAPPPVPLPQASVGISAAPAPALPVAAAEVPQEAPVQAAAAPALAVAAANAAPAVQGPVTFMGIDYVPAEIIARLQNIALVREVSSNRYALCTIPKGADWGKTSRTEKMLCIGGKPILIWIIGRVRSLWFFDRNGDPHLRVNLGVSLHSEAERIAATELFARARPRGDAEAPATVYAGRICSQRGKGEYCHTATAFTQVYDATRRLTTKSAMPQLSPVDLGKNDIVVVECNFTRWKRATEGKAKKSWSSFDVGFELNSIFLMHSAPEDLEAGEADEEEADISVEL